MKYELDRRGFLGLSGAGVVGATLLGCGRRDPAEASADQVRARTAPPADAKLVRVASVPTAVEGNVLPDLIKSFEQQSGYRVDLTTSPQLYELARDGKVDLLVSHYGHREVEAFVQQGLGEWPRTIFSNQMALVGPPSDPARVRGLDDLGEAFRRIAETKSPFVLNEIDGVHYLTEILWHAAGEPDRAGWLVDPKGSKDAAIEHASKIGGYSLWGLTPFLRLESAVKLDVEPLVLADPLLQRLMVSIVVKPGGVRAANATGATALQTFLLEPSTQARIRTIHYPGKLAVSWVPAGRHNRSSMLPNG